MRLRHAALGLLFAVLSLGPAPAQPEDHDHAAHAQVPAAAPASAPTSQPREGPFTWTLVKGQPIRYALSQTVSVRSNLPGAQAKPPLDVNGSLEIQPVDEATARVLMQAQLTEQVAPSPPPPPAPAPSGFSCGCPAAKPKAEPAPPPAPAGQRSMQARFELTRDGVLTGTAMSAGGQTELLARLLLPLPSRALKPGEVDSAPIDAPPVANRFGLLGTRTLTYVEDRVVDGKSLAVLRSLTRMVGEGRPGAGVEKSGEPSRGMEGTMELKAEGEGLFDLAAGRYQQAQSKVWLQINTSQLVDGVKKAVTLEQTQDTRLTLVESKGP